MKKLVLCISVMFLLTGCVSRTNELSPELVRIDSLETEVKVLLEEQNILLSEVEKLNGQVKTLELALEGKDREIEIINQDLQTLNTVDHLQFEYFSSMISEAVRLNGSGALEEKLYLIEDFDYTGYIITVRDKEDKLTEYKVSEACKILVAGQDYTEYQDIQEGMDFIESSKGDLVHKVILVLKDGIVEQIQMYGAGPWW